MINSFTFNPRYILRFLDNLPADSPPLQIHCKSGDDDLGVQTLKTSDVYHFSFHATAETLFFCGFQWGSKSSTFDVFSNKSEYCNIVDFEDEYCNYVMDPDGFYFSAGPDPKSSDFKFIGPWH
ncbi:hypothetical protein H5410_042831 [Solanum commersonii]|uniref:S-protein homolog n=1 Tax=Solanum commersonii TaxID=4109 RepID=A0A9J5XWS0_SOLCO|nr:hypothetical protein H5410_042831 [Solanum commersonii]